MPAPGAPLQEPSRKSDWNSEAALLHDPGLQHDPLGQSAAHGARGTRPGVALWMVVLPDLV